jgi:uncharacterized protein YjiS (DUF1127 family)
MSSNITNPSSLSKLGGLLFTRSAAYNAAPRHKGFLEAFKAWRARRAAENELYSLSDRDLADIGLTRYDIPYAVRTPGWVS